MTATRVGRFVLGALPIVLLLGAWEALAASGLVPRSLLPAASTVLFRLLQQLQSLAFLDHVAQTLIRVSAGFAIAVTAGIAIGLAAASSRVGARLLEPVVRVVAPIPKIALYPALMLIFGYAHASKIALVVADGVFPVLLATYYGARAVDPRLVWSARAAGASQAKCVFTVILPAALPQILTGCRVCLVLACVIVFLAEMISSTDGMGHLLIRAARSFQTVDMFVPLVGISILGLALSTTLLAVRRRLLVGFPEES